MTTKKTIKRLEGQVLRIDLQEGRHAYARLLKEPLIAFYDKLYADGKEPLIEDILALPIAFKIWVMNYTIKKGKWPIIGCAPLTSDLQEVPLFFKQDPLNGRLAIHQSIPQLAPHFERPATFAECIGLEQAAVWDPHHVEDRLRDHFAGRPSKWAVRARTTEEFVAHQEAKRRERDAHKLIR